MNALVPFLANAFGGSGRLKHTRSGTTSRDYRHLRRPNFKHAFNILISVFFVIFILNLQWGFLRLLFDALWTYFVAANFRCPSIFVMVISLSSSHVIREVWLSHEMLDISSAQMILAMKLTMFAWNVYDGQKPKESPSATRFLAIALLTSPCTNRFYFPSNLYGPNLDYVSYASSINGTLFESVGSTKLMQRVPHGRKRAAYRKMLNGLVYLGVFVVLFPSCNCKTALTPWFAKKNLLHRYLSLPFPC
ncbi:hypothetical protein JVT61DRAFT_15551 [Boletus reticuloceps]|uniref:Uncharacterized protein n=1 Tax=Boletus reticuloceps TaxID=495285 RepID=A0A8I3A3P6_9AGAM|nr:hypothetical protein JVT61DRAFT_15551 [Boletus reticuloceps]